MGNNFGVKRPIALSLIQQFRDGMKTQWNGWFGPGAPAIPQQQALTEGRAFDFPAGYNLRTLPRSDEQISFAQLRGLADSYDLLRIVIETRKDQLAKLRWSVKPKLDLGQAESQIDKTTDPATDAIEAFLRYPDGGATDWDTWIRALSEDMLVLDAATIYPRFTMNGKLGALELIDGATIKPIIGDDGRLPLTGPAYQQVLHGIVASQYSRDQLLYWPRNVRTNRVYGYGPVEQIIMTVNIALRRQMSQLAAYTEGNIPEAFIGTPDSWTPTQIKEMQQSFDALLAGNIEYKRRIRFLPGLMAKSYVPTREPGLKDEMDDWLARIVCAVFGVSFHAFVREMSRSSSENSLKQAKEEGLLPYMQWIKVKIDFIIQHPRLFNRPDLEFVWADDDQIDAKVAAETSAIYVAAGVKTRNMVRDELGADPIEGGDIVTVTVGNTIMPLSDAIMPMADRMPAQIEPPPANGNGTKKPAKSAKEGAVGKTVRPFTRRRALGKAHTITVESRAVKAQAKKLKSTVAKVLRKKRREVLAQIKAAARAKGFVKAEGDGTGVTASLATLTATEIVAAVQFGDWQSLSDPLEQSATLIFTDAAGKAFLSLGIEAGPDALDLVHANAVEWAAGRAAELVTGVEETTRDAIQSLVVDALEQGWSSQQLAAALTDNFTFSDARAEMIARTELAYANVAGSLAIYEKNGNVTSKEWLLGSDPCDVCLDNSDDGVIDYGDTFASGDDAPPAHPNCVCDLRVYSEADTPDDDTES